jgi:hypothetical protein
MLPVTVSVAEPEVLQIYPNARVAISAFVPVPVFIGLML